MNRTLLYLLLLSILLVILSTQIDNPGKIFAQNSVKYRQKTILSFGDRDIEGEGKSPFGAIIMTAKTKKGDGLIKIRKHWRKEIVRSANKISNKK